MGRVDAKVALVTGGGGGIGVATCILLAQEGATVVVADIDEAKAQQCAQRVREAGGTAEALAVDISDEASVEGAIRFATDRFGRIDILDNNATTVGWLLPVPDRTITEMSVDTWDQMMAVNLRGTMLMCKHTIPVMIDGGGGSIVNISSGAAITGDVRPTAYGVSKAGINSVTRYVAASYGKQGIRCNTVMPGPTITDRFLEVAPPERLDMLLRHSLLPRLTQPEDIANAVLFLASDDSAMITAQDFLVDAGLLSHTPIWYDSTQTVPATDHPRIQA
jgi:NAD(P)-dependent dehydrogenase (short-subunit alcohol dehydrogenase family)